MNINVRDIEIVGEFVNVFILFFILWIIFIEEYNFLHHS